MLNRRQKNAVFAHQALIVACLAVYFIGRAAWREYAWAPVTLAAAMALLLVSMLLVFSRAGALRRRYVVLFATMLVIAPVLVLFARHA